MKHIYDLIDKLEQTQTLSLQEWVTVIENQNPEISEYVFSKARAIREEHYGKDIYIRGLIEFSNYCKNDCLYCGIRKSNRNANRYRLSPDQILQCCEEGWRLGFRTFVLQSGEDPYFTDERLVEIIHAIKERYPDCAITLSIGEKSKESYLMYKAAGADRYLLRHETATEAHYCKLHPESLSLKNRIECLYHLKEAGFQVGAGFMVGSPYQTSENLAADMIFLKELNPAMVGIGPFISHHNTPFADQENGTLEQTLYMLGLIRLMLPKVLLPATTALGTIHPQGRELGMKAGANVVMPNLSPRDVRKDYLLYDNKLSSGEESAQSKHLLEAQMKAIGYQLVTDRGDSKN